MKRLICAAIILFLFINMAVPAYAAIDSKAVLNDNYNSVTGAGIDERMQSAGWEFHQGIATDLSAFDAVDRILSNPPVTGTMLKITRTADVNPSSSPILKKNFDEINFDAEKLERDDYKVVWEMDTTITPNSGASVSSLRGHEYILAPKNDISNPFVKFRLYIQTTGTPIAANLDVCTRISPSEQWTNAYTTGNTTSFSNVLHNIRVEMVFKEGGVEKREARIFFDGGETPIHTASLLNTTASSCGSVYLRPASNTSSLNLFLDNLMIKKEYNVPDPVLTTVERIDFEGAGSIADVGMAAANAVSLISQDSAYKVGKNLEISTNSGTPSVSKTFNSIDAPLDASLSEEYGAYFEFDAKVNGTANSSAEYVVAASGISADDIVSIKLTPDGSGGGKIEAVSGGLATEVKVFDANFNEWHRIKLDFVFTSQAQFIYKFNVWVDGVIEAENITFSGSSLGVFGVRGANMHGALYSVDNINIYTIEGAISPVDYGKLISAIRRAEKVYKEAIANKGLLEGQYMESVLSLYLTYIDAAKTVCENSQSAQLTLNNAADSLNGRVLTANDRDYAQGGVLARADFQNGQTGGFTGSPYVESVSGVGIGRALKIKQDEVSLSFPKTQVSDAGNSGLTYKIEGANTVLFMEFDVMFDNLVEAKKSVEFQLGQEGFTDVTIMRVIFNGKDKKIQAVTFVNGSSGDAYLAESSIALEDSVWNRVRIEVNVTNATARQAKYKLFIDGIDLFANSGEKISLHSYLSTSAGKADSIGMFKVLGSSLSVPSYIDNFVVYKQQSAVSPEALVDRSELISLLRTADKKLASGVTGTAENEYDAVKKQNLQDLFGQSLSVYNSAVATKAEIDSQALLLKSAINDFVPNGKTIKIGQISYLKSDNTPADSLAVSGNSLKVSAPVTASSQANGSKVVLIAGLYKNNTNLVNGRQIDIATSGVQSFDANQTGTLQAVIDLTSYINRNDLFLKVFIWENFDTIIPLYDSLIGFNPSTSVTGNERKAVIKGVTKPNTRVTFELLDTGKDFIDVNTVNNINLKDVFLYVEEQVSDDYGNYKFEHVMPTVATNGGTSYPYRIQADNQIIDEDYLIYYTDGDVLTGLNAVYNDSSDIGAVTAYLWSNKAMLEIDTPLYSKLALENLTAAAEKVTQKQYTVSELEEFKTEFYKGLAVIAVNKLTDKADVAELLKRDSSLSISSAIGIDGSGVLAEQRRYDKFMGFSSAAKLKLAERVINNRSYTNVTFKSVFNNLVVPIAVEDSKSWQDIGLIISDNRDLLSSFAVYSGLNETKQGIVQQKVYSKKYFATIQELDDFIREKVNEQAQSNPPGGGGGGGGGGAPVVKTELVLPPQESPSITPMERIGLPFDDIDDVDDVEWAAQAIQILAGRNIINGKGNGKFMPNDMITREEFVKIVVLAFDLLDSGAVTEFSDVSNDDWYYAYVASAQKAGIVNGVSETRFGVGEPLTRQELATLAYRAGIAAEVNFRSDLLYIPYDDEDSISDFAKDAIAALSSNGIINGVGANTFAPAEVCTRAQAAKILYQTLMLAESY